MAMFSTVYLPKFVCIHNPRLWVLFQAFMLLLYIVFLWRFVALEQHSIKTAASGTVTVNGFATGISEEDAAAASADARKKAFCTQPGYLDYFFEDNSSDSPKPSMDLQNIQCAEMCNEGTSQSCVYPMDFSQQTLTGLFVPTFFQDQYMADFADDNRDKSNWFIPGIEQVKLSFSHELWVDHPADNLAGPRPRVEGSSSGRIGQPVTTVVLNNTGDMLRTFSSGEIVTLSIAEVLLAGTADEFTDSGSRLGLDSHYSVLEEGIYPVSSAYGPQGPALRLTGANLKIHIDYTDKGFCQRDPKAPIVQAGGGIVACVTVKAKRGWVQRQKTDVYNFQGASRTRTMHGLQISFETGGTLSAADSFGILESFTMLFIGTKFRHSSSIASQSFFLGSLSTVYSGVLHQETGLITSMTGFAARLLSYSASFHDMKDGETAISKQRLLERFSSILKYEEDLDANEREKFVDFIYKSILNNEEESTQETACNSGAYCEAAMSGNSFPIKALQGMLDRNRRPGLGELIFKDASLMAVSSITDTQLQERLAVGAIDPYSTEEQSMSRIDDSLAKNDRLRESCEHIKTMLQETIDRAKAVIGEDDSLKRSLALHEVEKQGGEPQYIPPQTLADGSVYEGEWVGTVRHGKGKLTLEDGSTYEGQFELGKVHGNAVYMLPSGARYEGQWRNGQQDGEGREVSLDGAVYQGKYQEGIKQGIASIYLPDGSTYQGEVLAGRLHGRGKYMWGNGHMYEGDWADDCMHGDGVYTWPDGIQFTGQYANNLKNGRGMMCWPDGRRFIGTYDNNMKHGKGKMVMGDGMIVEGEWANGKEINGRMPNSNSSGTKAALPSSPFTLSNQTQATTPEPLTAQEATKEPEPESLASEEAEEAIPADAMPLAASSSILIK
eukprot:CAMPEP_0197636308 /NCGR_PEP_ID=MMETSP1338-20131121/11855_1 /TAXON_ID=43686 ORGANISM="Pelagodinium beii, Strain RCC1491" /NCGR_SAMPLE_ID=MMETSP1338 /ASSEMBLY_ACC=CAM_ASM_000754 /LENGTH=893 /DNA_ID=CAMNT_0043208519 /DNA_START=51 /DNA_END=2733 /DNA_ORIENTATION=-